MNPRVSVVLPVYNDEKYIKEAIDSILNQTFYDFELIVIDDRSTDKTSEIVKSFKDSRIRFYINQKNLGRAGSDNFALNLIKGTYVAKMDSDDVCHPERLAKQVEYLEKHPDVNVVGSWMQNFGHSSFLNKYPETAALAQAMTLFTLPVGNPSIMLRTALFHQLGMKYDEQLRQTEDFDFFARYAADLTVVTLPEALLQYRTYPNTAKKDILTERHLIANIVRENFLSKWGIEANRRELAIHHLISHLDRPLQTISLTEINLWLLKLAEFNRKKPFFDQQALLRYLAFRWFQVCYTYPQPKFGSMRHYYQSELCAYCSISSMSKLKMVFKGLQGYF
ncbi:glycosyltransferase family 2 protein [Rufibacter tibetensis]|uniref:glycosyltransferase family 2 protein n=1 Tax=Rufibacter tibetensis TaxID=512763 RepID=UPI0007811AC0|nr:glycosyltransferase family A protein [Rufibacter tibetensis]